ncbi:tRNA (adenosine(37)-N6)-threonylcarbamoyltransferase complex transferase subunit TsaD [Roseospirillum parvum]|nr:tRNA (adenosine(37)-N6)-threonylcarbamoyltransferase complex transferase subunit TsaD [Roseospirillum parvum]
MCAPAPAPRDAPAWPLVLGIETSCDETACAVVDGTGTVRAEAVLSQLDEHAPFGGVVPEIAARSHLEHVDRLMTRVMTQAGATYGELDGVAATAGPGLIGGVMVGLMTAKAVALAHGKPLLAVNHLAAHALTARLTDTVPFPYLLLLVSGGHCQILVVEAVDRFRRLGTTIDDAAGEAFDKVAKMLGLGYPGGPAVERWAARGNAGRFAFPRPLKGRPGCDFSFSGLKTAVRQAAESLPPGPFAEADLADLAAGFQAALIDSLGDRLEHGLQAFTASHPEGRHLVVAGGVAANSALRAALLARAEAHGLALVAPPPRLCTDNAVMVAWAGIERLRQGLIDPLDVAPRPRWPLDPHAPPAGGTRPPAPPAGEAGTKA